MARDERRRQIAAGVAVLAGVACTFVLVLMVGLRLPGVGGEFFAKIAGIVTTPFLMEASLCILGFVVVMLLNYWRLRREGDECVYLEEVKESPSDLPEQARWAVYREKPLDPEAPSAADLLEGAIAIGDHEAAIEILASMDEAERHLPEVIRQRILLAKATGKDDLAKRLEAELAG